MKKLWVKPLLIEPFGIETVNGVNFMNIYGGF